MGLRSWLMKIKKILPKYYSQEEVQDLLDKIISLSNRLNTAREEEEYRSNEYIQILLDEIKTLRSLVKTYEERITWKREELH